MRERAKAAVASAGAAAIIGLPVVTAGTPTTDPPLDPRPRKHPARPPSYADLEARLRLANKRVRFYRAKARRHWHLVNRLRAVIRQGFDPVRATLLCIHEGEGSWNDPGAPYWGGLQMDWSFQTTYGRPLVRRYGTADHWPPGAQLAVGEIAVYAGRGFGPWPNTRQGCG